MTGIKENALVANREECLYYPASGFVLVLSSEKFASFDHKKTTTKKPSDANNSPYQVTVVGFS